MEIKMSNKVLMKGNEALAEAAGISAVEVSLIESADIHKTFSMEVFYNISRALDVDPTVLLSEISVPM